MENCIEVKHLSKAFGSGHTTRVVLDDCDFSIERGKLTALIGKSGSGKTTILQILGGLLLADQGEIVVDGEAIQNKTDAELSDYRATKTGFVFQNFELLPDYTVEENICFVSDLQGRPRDPDWLEQLIEALNLQGLEDRFPHELSGGEQQRTAIARALYHQPVVIFADEPTGNLDNRNSDEVFWLLKDCARRFNQTIVMVTHDLGLAKQSDRVLMIEEGKVFPYEA
ncbi:MAG: ABC transporter ATP-binding protein [Erysipelotrichaceae bacterium]|nr:ABC transporter ATP-binding protein [Erysipelotrichaceae bacterium]